MTKPVTVSEAIRTRKSTRAFSERPVPEKMVRELLELAGQSPSGGNLQPWKVIAVAGEVRAALVKTVQERCLANPTGETPAFPVYAPKLPEPYRSRRSACGEAMYAALGIPREDKPARLGQVFKNFEFFGAPVGLIITMDRCMCEAQFIDVGIFLQSLMLSAKEAGLDTCPQASWVMWPETIREVLDLDESEIVMSGMALGYADPDHPINRFSQPRAAAEEYISLRGF